MTISLKVYGGFGISYNLKSKNFSIFLTFYNIFML